MDRERRSLWAGGRDGRTRAIAWIVVAPWIVFLILRLAGVGTNQWMVAAIGATPYVAAAILIPIVLAAALRVWPAALAGVVVAAIFAALVLPRAFGGPTEANPPGPSLRVLAVNMKRGEGSPQELAGLVDELDPDVVSVEELTPGLAEDLDAAGIGDALPHQRLEPGQGPNGTGLYSRYRLGAPLDEFRSGYAVLVSAMVEAPGGQPVEISSIHTAPPTAAGWSHDLEGISPAPTDGRAVLMGDFNSTIDHAPFRGVLDRGWADAAATVGSGLVPTWPEGRRIPPLYAIDHVLVGDAIGVRSFSAHEIAGTDHRAVFAELQVPGG